MDLQIWAAVLKDFIFPSRRTTGKVSILLGDKLQYYRRQVHKFGEFLPISYRFSEKEIENLIEPLPKFVNPSQRFQESPSCFGIKCFKTLKWLPKIGRATENF